MVALSLIFNGEKYMGLVVALPFFDNIAPFHQIVAQCQCDCGHTGHNIEFLKNFLLCWGTVDVKHVQTKILLKPGSDYFSYNTATPL